MYLLNQRSRAKGRDFYDILYMGFLNLKFGTSSWLEVSEKILESIKDIDWDLVASDVQPFLMNVEENIKLFVDYLKQLEF